MPLSLLNHSALALFAQCTRIPTSARSIGFSVPFGFVLVRVRVPKLKVYRVRVPFAIPTHSISIEAIFTRMSGP
jgi:ABC-type sulfate transport system permease component